MPFDTLKNVFSVERRSGEYAVFHLLPDPVPWYIVGPLFGLCVVALYGWTNNHFGVSGSYVQLLDAVRGRGLEVWRLWFPGGLQGDVPALVVSTDHQKR
ncbi:MAG: hypothetical protein NVS2B16_07270 [Chloroflexota bacterium]